MSCLHGRLERTAFHHGASVSWCPYKHVVQLIPGNLQTLGLPCASPRPACCSQSLRPAPFPWRTRGAQRFLPTSSPVKTRPSLGNKTLHFPAVKMERSDLYWQQSCVPSAAVRAFWNGKGKLLVRRVTEGMEVGASGPRLWHLPVLRFILPYFSLNLLPWAYL